LQLVPNIKHVVKKKRREKEKPFKKRDLPWKIAQRFSFFYSCSAVSCFLSKKRMKSSDSTGKPAASGQRKVLSFVVLFR